MADYTEISYDVADGVATITLDRPEHMNAFTATMMVEMIAAFDEIDADDDVRAVIVTGAGRAFCAGADLSSGGDTFDNDARGRAPSDPEAVRRDGGGRVSLRIFDCTKPVIAAINGHAVGVGITMTLPMDIRIVSENAKIGFVFARRGIVPEAASSWFLPRLVGISQAAQWCYSGRVFPAAEAAEGGLVELVDDDQLLDRARELATEIARHNAFGLAQAKRAVNQTLDAQGYYAALQSVFDIHSLGHGNAISVGGYPVLMQLEEMKEEIADGGSGSA